MNKKTLLIFIGAIALASFIMGTCFVWYKVFDKEPMSVTSFEVKLNDEGKGVSIVNMFPTSPDKIDQIANYEFAIKNTGGQVGSYNLLLEETALNKLEDGCTEQTLLTRNQLQYLLTINGKLASKGLLSDIKKNIIDFRTINAAATNNYSLKIWVPESASNTAWQNKHYHYHINIVPLTEGGIKNEK